MNSIDRHDRPPRNQNTGQYTGKSQAISPDKYGKQRFQSRRLGSGDGGRQGGTSYDNIVPQTQKASNNNGINVVRTGHSTNTNQRQPLALKK